VLLNFHGDKILIGYDLGNTYSQISYCPVAGGAVETISTVSGEESFNIPTVLCKRRQQNQWFYGREALRFAGEEDGILVDNLLALALDGEPIQLEGCAYDPAALLTLFLKRSLGLLSMVSSVDRIAALMITCEEMNSRLIEVLGQAFGGLNLKNAPIYFQSYTESFYYYMIHQPAGLWAYQTVLCDYDRERMKVYRMDCNKNTRPITVFIEEKEYPFPALDPLPEAENLRQEKFGRMDREFLEIADDFCKDQRISSVFLIGEGYSEGWLKDSLRFLCRERRVFQGCNLYSKGACFGLRERYPDKNPEKSYVFLGKEKLKANIGMKLYRRGEESYYALLDAGVNWFEAKNSVEFYLQDENTIELKLMPLGGKGVKLARITLDELKNEVTRLRMCLTMTGENKMKVEISDLGFGEFFPSGGQVWSEEVKLY